MEVVMMTPGELLNFMLLVSAVSVAGGGIVGAVLGFIIGRATKD